MPTIEVELDNIKLLQNIIDNFSDKILEVTVDEFENLGFFFTEKVKEVIETNRQVYKGNMINSIDYDIENSDDEVELSIESPAEYSLDLEEGNHPQDNVDLYRIDDWLGVKNGMEPGPDRLRVAAVIKDKLEDVGPEINPFFVETIEDSFDDAVEKLAKALKSRFK